MLVEVCGDVCVYMCAVDITLQNEWLKSLLFINIFCLPYNHCKEKKHLYRNQKLNN